MNIWIITVGEPLPMDGSNVRLFRSGIFFNELVSAGHQVTWWTSSIDHSKKKIRHYGDQIYPNTKSRIILLNGPLYTRNISIKRLINHQKITKDFKKRIQMEELPDLIVCSFPLIELAKECVKYANMYNIPIVTDVRDIWPDLFLDLFPKWTRLFIRFFFVKFFNDTKFIFKNSNSIIAVSDSYLEWGLQYANRSQSKTDKVFPLGYPEQRIDNSKIKQRDQLLRQLGVDQSKTILLFIGSFGQTYDLSPIIKVAEHFERANKDLQFVFCGDGDKNEQWRSEAQCRSNIIFTGWLDSYGINCLMEVSSIGLASYKRGAPQGLPNKFFEYMSFGLPILSSLEGEAKRMLDEENIGLTYDPLIKDDLIEKIKILSDLETSMLLSKNSKKLFNSKYSAKIVYTELRGFVENMHDEKYN